MVRPPSARWTSSSCARVPRAAGGLRRQLAPSRQVVGGVVAQRVAVGQGRGEPLGQRRGLHHLQPDPAHRSRAAARQVPAGHPGVWRPGAQDHQVTVVPGAGVIAHRVRRDLGDLAPGQPLVAAAGPRASRGSRAARAAPAAARRSRRAGRAAAGELAAQRRVDGRTAPGSSSSNPRWRVRQRGRLLEQASSASSAASVSEPAARKPARAPRRPARPTARGRAAPARVPGPPAAAHPDQAEVPDAGAAGLGFALQVHDLEAAPPRRHRVHGAEHAAADTTIRCVSLTAVSILNLQHV
jgi:hypothetical protein